MQGSGRSQSIPAPMTPTAQFSLLACVSPAYQSTPDLVKHHATSAATASPRTQSPSVRSSSSAASPRFHRAIHHSPATAKTPEIRFSTKAEMGDLASSQISPISAASPMHAAPAAKHATPTVTAAATGGLHSASPCLSEWPDCIATALFPDVSPPPLFSVSPMAGMVSRKAGCCEAAAGGRSTSSISQPLRREPRRRRLFAEASRADGAQVDRPESHGEGGRFGLETEVALGRIHEHRVGVD